MYADQAMRQSVAGSVSRPRGHHAERGRDRGFCLFGKVAAAAIDAGVPHLAGVR
jgi:acetoin utilization deacetylase AcuC-like enzyme